MRVPLLVGAAVVTLLVGTVPAQASSPKVWARFYDGSTVRGGVSVAADPGNGNVYVLNKVGCCPLSTIDLIAYTSSGTKLWTVNSGGPIYDAPRAVTVDPATHDVFFTGTRKEGLLTEAYSATGTLLWTKVRAVTGYQLNPVGIVADGHGRVVVAASTRPSGSSTNFLTIAYQISSGNRLWLEHYGADLSDDDPVGIAVDPALSQVYVTGWSMASNFPEMVTLAYASGTGAQAWIARNTGGDDSPVGVAVDTSNHNVYAVASTAADGLEFNTFGYTSSGAVAWNTTYHPDTGSNDDPVAVAVDSGNGQVYVAGIRRKASGSIPTVLVGYSSAGSELWSLQRDDGNETHGFPRVLAADPTTHHVFLGSDHSISTDHIASMTRAFTGSGAAVWSATQSSPNAAGDGGPTAICVDSGNAQVYVTGAETDANDGHAQMFTVAYQTT